MAIIVSKGSIAFLSAWRNTMLTGLAPSARSAIVGGASRASIMPCRAIRMIGAITEKPSTNAGRHRLAGDDRRAEIPMHDLAEVADVLNVERLVEEVRVPDLRLARSADVGPSDERDRIARDESRQCERDEGDAEQHRDKQQDAP